MIWWKITLYERPRLVLERFKVKIEGRQGNSVGMGNTPQRAYDNARLQLVIKPWLVNAK